MPTQRKPAGLWNVLAELRQKSRHHGPISFDIPSSGDLPDEQLEAVSGGNGTRAQRSPVTNLTVTFNGQAAGTDLDRTSGG